MFYFFFFLYKQIVYSKLLLKYTNIIRKIQNINFVQEALKLEYEYFV